MPRIKHVHLRNAKAYGKSVQIEFDAEGFAEVSQEDVDYLAAIPGYTAVVESPASPAILSDPAQLGLFVNPPSIDKNPPIVEPGPSVVIDSTPVVEVVHGEDVPDVTPLEGFRKRGRPKKVENPKNDA